MRWYILHGSKRVVGVVRQETRDVGPLLVECRNTGSPFNQQWANVSCPLDPCHAGSCLSASWSVPSHADIKPGWSIIHSLSAVTKQLGSIRLVVSGLSRFCLIYYHLFLVFAVASSFSAPRTCLPNKQDTWIQCWPNVGPTSKTVGQHKANIGYMPLVCRIPALVIFRLLMLFRIW